VSTDQQKKLHRKEHF